MAPPQVPSVAVQIIFTDTVARGSVPVKFFSRKLGRRLDGRDSSDVDLALRGGQRLLGRVLDEGVLGVDALVVLEEPGEATLAGERPAGDHPHAALAADRDVAL